MDEVLALLIFSRSPRIVLALTASAMRGDREKIMEAGFTDYLAKPAGPELLRDTVERLLRQAAQAAERGA